MRHSTARPSIGHWDDRAGVPRDGPELAVEHRTPFAEAHMSLPVVLDPGHGGSVRCGNSSPEGARLGDGLEKQVTWALAGVVARHLPEAQLTRGEHDNPSLSERIEKARRLGAAAFVSLHASPGAESGVWIHPRANRASAQLAERITAHLRPSWGGRVEVRPGELAVLNPDRHGPSTAACLVEFGLGGGNRGLGLAAGALARGVRGYFGQAAYGRGPAEALDLAQPMPDVNTPQLLRAWNDRQADFRAGVADTTAFPYSAICRLIMDGDAGWGTGFYVSPNRILTAGHVVADVQGKITVVPGMNGEGVQPFGQSTCPSAT